MRASTSNNFTHELRRDATLELWEQRLTYKLGDDFEPYSWPPTEFFSLIALAQHYGVPTRALDWTWSALTAAYFACCSTRTPEPTDRIVVWAFNYLEDNLSRMFETHDTARTILLYTAPGSDNPNLRAQRGLFMLKRHNVEHHLTPFTPTPYDVELADWSSKSLIPRTVIKVTVPSSEAPAVLATLSAAGVTAATLFPGLAGVVREMKDEKRIAGERISIKSSHRAQGLLDEILQAMLHDPERDV